MLRDVDGTDGDETYGQRTDDDETDGRTEDDDGADGADGTGTAGRTDRSWTTTKGWTTGRTDGRTDSGRRRRRDGHDGTGGQCIYIYIYMVTKFHIQHWDQGNGKAFLDTHSKIRLAIEMFATIAIVLARLQPKNGGLETKFRRYIAYIH